MRQNLNFDFKSIRSPLSKQLHPYRIDFLIASILAIAMLLTSFVAAQAIPTPLLTDFYAQDVWFGSDLPTVFGNITSLSSDFGRNNKHPLFPLLIFPLVFGAGKLLQLDPVTATRLVLALTAAVWIAGLYSLFRLMSCQRLDAILFSLVGGISAAAVFWFVVPDSFPFASVTILLALVFVAMTQYHQFSPAWYIAIGVLTISITITNWMVGLLAAIANFRWKKVLQIITLTLGVTTALWFVQRVIFVSSGFPFQPKTFIGEKKFMTGPSGESILSALSSFAYQTMVMPAVRLGESVLRPEWVKPEFNTLAPGSGGVWGMIAAIAWTGLLLLGVWGFFTTNRHGKLRFVLGLTIIGQLLIHSVYGTGETFLYSLHFAPLLLTLMAFVSLTRFRLVGLALAGLLIISAGINNRSQFTQFTTALLEYGTPRQQVQAQMGVRPGDFWSRSAGHVVLAAAGTPAEAKAYHEPGGSFSPRPGSFGVSIWMLDQNGQPQATSDTIPLDQIQQQLVNLPGQTIPGVVTKTKLYQATWAPLKSGAWQLSLSTVAANAAKPTIMIRSVGPAGGAVRSLRWDNQQLLINDRWVIRPPNAVKVYLGSERSPDWMRQKLTETQWQDEKGWGYARLELEPGSTWNLEIVDQAPAPAIANQLQTVASPVLNLPDRQFADSFNAQIAHLKMGVVDNQTRPGDPLDYPLPRFRDGAYELVALARTGHLELAKQLVPYFAATDFINGTQPEADIPALGIWAITAVAAQVNQPEFDQSIWADVRRKADLIGNLQASRRPGYPIAERSRIPFSEHPDFMDLELVAGKMDAAPGLIVLDATANMMSYRALLDAATLADRVKQPVLATRWRSQATQLQTAWQQSFARTFASMDATYTTGLWPSGIATINQDVLKQGLNTRWQKAYDDKGHLRQLPANTNFNLAEVHQWLFLNQPERVWTTLRWFWQNQSSPGLFTWWGTNDDPKGTRIPDSLSQWHRFRGWVNPPHFTPHYWTAAEMLLLQLDMLAYVDPTASEPTLVVGAGIPKEWLNQPIRVQGLGVGGDRVNWAWDGKQMTVQMQGRQMKIRLGEAFPRNTPVDIQSLSKGSSASTIAASSQP
ncbi:MAG: hypothetical protein NW220_12875 [Leptolyngbyaceae cyanobacterium bins.349]|nr:hypothetical protein [Leptolyngbyaceae cyanobacterium bins.349]